MLGLSPLALERLYILLGIAGFIGTAAQLPPYLVHGLVQGTVEFWKATLATPASTFIVVDIFVLGGAVIIWMFTEARRIGIAARWVWVYVAVSAFIGISLAVPLFLAQRQRHLRLASADTGAPQGADVAGIFIATALALMLVTYSLTHLPA